METGHMPDLVVRPSAVLAHKPWALQLRYHNGGAETEYVTIARLSLQRAKDTVAAGAATWLCGEPAEDTPPARATSDALRRATGMLIDRLAGTAWGDRGDIDGADAQTLLAEAGLATQRPATESDIETIEYVAVGDMIYVPTDEAEELRRLTAGYERHRP
jgi:hypothetical protein